MSQNAAKRGDMIATPCTSIRALSASVARNWHLADDHVTSFHLIHIHQDNISRALMGWRLAAIFEVERKSDSSLSVGMLSVIAVYLS